jgi:hypothetical protein
MATLSTHSYDDIFPSSSSSEDKRVFNITSIQQQSFPISIGDYDVKYSKLSIQACPPEVGGDQESRFSHLLWHLFQTAKKYNIYSVDASGLIQLLPTFWNIKEGDTLTITSPFCIIYKTAKGEVLEAFDVSKGEDEEDISNTTGPNFLKCRSCGRVFSGLESAEEHAVFQGYTGIEDILDESPSSNKMIIEALDISLDTMAFYLNDILSNP